jgi:hypothetical protein
MITYERVHELLDYDPKTGIFTWKVGRGGRRFGRVAGNKRSDGYIKIQIDGRSYLAHRLAWLYIYGYLPEHDVDQIDRDPSNNRIDNLREVSRTCNLRNCGNHSSNTSGVKGVSFHKQRGKI